MNAIAPTAPQAAPPTELVDFWNQILAPRFLRFRHFLVDGLSRHSDAVLPRIDVPVGSRILDVGCGFGDNAIHLAGRTGLSGHVGGVDCCEAFLDHARTEAIKQGADNLRFVAGDMEQGIGYRGFDLAFARFGRMFFAYPVAGLRAMRACLRPGGRVAHIVWRQRSDNPWLTEPHDILRRFLPAPGDDALSCGPGPFSMADVATTRAKMQAAGFIDIAFERIDAKVLVGRDIADAIAFQLAIGPAGEVFREAGPMAKERRPQIEAALAARCREIEALNGGLWMDSSSWLITARAPRT